ncbi:MAG: hypothetical protein COA33_009215 [Fluviicola sp.]|nr:hypothetical protein [Fluviicola sp.]
MHGVCKLCLEEKPLIKTSHILPDFLFADLFDEKHKLRALEMKELLSKSPRISKPSTGDYEGGILCNDCDNQIIGQYETYASNVIKNNLSANKKVAFENQNFAGTKSIQVRNLNYKKSKLFLTSLLWRASITSLDRYKNIELGPYGEPLRLELINGILSESSIFQINIIEFEQVDEFTSFIGLPVKHKVDNTTYYSIIIKGYLIIYFLKENRLSKTMADYKLTDRGELVIPQMPHEQVKGFIFGYAGVK